MRNVPTSLLARPPVAGVLWLLLTALTPAGGAAQTGAARSRPAFPDAAPLSALSADTVAFMNVNVVPMDRERTLMHRAVVVAAGRIVALGSPDSVAVPPGAVKIDGGDSLFVLPGLADMHSHIRYRGDLLLLLANGVTTVRNMRGSPFHLDLRARVASGALLGPRIVTAGPIFYGGPASGGSVANARALADSEARAGYDFFKVYDGLPKASYAAVVEEAARFHLPVAGHIPAALGVEGALRVHQYSLEHAEQFIYHGFGADLDVTRIPGVAREVAAAHSYVTPTLAYMTGLELQWDAPGAVFERPEVRDLDPETYAYWRTDPGHSSALNHVFQPFLQQLVREFERAGVRLLAGTDFYIYGNVAGFSLHRELQALVDAGLSPYQALEAATRNAAECLREERFAGTVRVGNVADLLVLNANPLVDIRNTTKRAGVMVRGRWLPAAELDRLLDSLAREFAPGQQLVDRLMQPGTAAFLRAASDSIGAFEPSAVSQVGAYLVAGHRPDDAIAVFELVVRRFPSSAGAYDDLGDGYAAAGRTPDAIQAYERALVLDPSRSGTRAKLQRLRGS